MSAGIDVLFVLDSLIAQTKERGGSPSTTTIIEARNGIAELLDALTAERAIRNSETKPPTDIEHAAFARTDTALAKVQP